MNIQLPNGQKIILDESLSLEDKLNKVEELTKKWEDVIHLNWESDSVKYFLDSLANYIVWHKEEHEKGMEDKEVMSRKKVEKLTKFKKDSKQVNFTDLNKNYKTLLFGEGGQE